MGNSPEIIGNYWGNLYFGIRTRIVNPEEFYIRLYDVPMEWILASEEAEVYYLPKLGEVKDPIFRMATNDGVLVDFAFPGDLIRIQRISDDQRTLETVLELDPTYRFHLNRNNLPVNGVIDDPQRVPEQILEQLVDYAHRKASSTLGSNPRNKHANDFEVFTYNATVARFKTFQALRSASDIIADESPQTIPIKLGNGCGFGCGYCDMGSISFVPYTISQLESLLQFMQRELIEKRGKNTVERMNEGFGNVSDISHLELAYRAGKTDLSVRVAGEMIRKYFPWLNKIGTFIGAPTTLAVLKDNPNFIDEIVAEGYGFNRLYLGIETAHDEGSRMLDKNVTYEQKRLVSRRVQDNEYVGLKLIVQLGALGKGFYPLDKSISSENFVPWEAAMDSTIELINDVRPYRVMESVHQLKEGLPVNMHYRSGRIMPMDGPQQIEQERRRLRAGISYALFRGKFVDPEPGYEAFVPKGLPADQMLIVHD
ncbi:MAG: hypothetical protein AABX25_02200 [Nanoarchaeota archaeon]